MDAKLFFDPDEIQAVYLLNKTLAPPAPRRAAPRRACTMECVALNFPRFLQAATKSRTSGAGCTRIGLALKRCSAPAAGAASLSPAFETLQRDTEYHHI